MWFLDTETHQLRQAVDSRARIGSRRYAILSHTWGDGEVLFQDMEDLEGARKKAGWGKIEATCRIAKRKFRHAWVDTCCIDKRSSAELSEAINSMFAWYRDSTVCYVFLEDLDPLPPGQTSAEQRAYLGKHLPKCRWFTRGWTLQELIAPRVVEFFDKEWNFIGTKSDLEDILSSITNVDVAILRDSTVLSSVPVARRMSWAADRRTTRIEDRAYCLLGLFDVNMPLLYGEGSNAFVRLQEHLANQINDLSLFAWQVEVKEFAREVPTFGGIFAESPKDFRHCVTLKRHHDRFQLKNEFTITNNGLKMDAVVRKLRTGWMTGSSDVSEADYLLSLDCVETSDRTENAPKWLAICLTKVGSTFVRLRPHKVYVSSSRSEWTKQSVRFTMYICRSLPAAESERIEAFIGAKIRLELDESVQNIISQAAAFPPDAGTLSSSRAETVVFDCHGKDNFIGVFRLTLLNGHRVAVICGMQWNGQACEPWVAVYGTLWNPRESESTFIDAAYPASSPPDLEEIKDMMLCNNSDSSGLYQVEKLPLSVYVAGYGLRGWPTLVCCRKIPRLSKRVELERNGTSDGSQQNGTSGENALASPDEKNVYVYKLGIEDTASV